MGQLDSLIIATETVEYNGQKLVVRGLGLPEITFVIRHHGDTLTSLYAQAIAGTLPSSVEGIAFAMADEFAPIAGKVIACGLGDPQEHEKAATLPLKLQCELLEKIVELTLVDAGGLGKLMEIVTRAMTGMVTLMPRNT